MKKQLALFTMFSFLWMVTSAWAGSGLNGTPVGNETPDTGTFTNLEATTQFKLGIETATSFDSINNNKVKSSAADSTSGFLTDELQGGTNVTISEIDVGGNKKISVSVADKLTTKGDVLTHDGTSENRLAVGASGQVLTADPASPSGVKWDDTSRDDTDGVDITFGREVEFDPGTGAVASLDLNGTDLFIGATDPTISLGSLSASVLSKTDIPNTTPPQQQVVVKVPIPLLDGSYKLRLENTQGVSNFYLPVEQSFFDGSTWTEATSAAAWSGRLGHSSVVFDNKMWVIGGYGGGFSGSPTNDAWYSSDGITWTQATASAPWSVRRIHSSVVFDNKMWVIGGFDSSPASAKNDVWYSTDGVTWTQATAAAPWSGRFGHSSVVFDNKMWVIGGTGSTSYNDVWYSTDGATWTQATASAAWITRSVHGSVVFDGKMWVIGGGSSNNDVWYSTDGDTWIEATPSAAWVERYVVTLLAFDNKMWVIGGSEGSFVGLNDVWFTSE